MNAMENNTNRSRTSKSTKIFVVIAIAGTMIVPLAHFIPAVSNLSTPLYPKRVCAFYYTWYGNTTAYPGEEPGSNASISHWNENGHTGLGWNIGAADHPSMNTTSEINYDSCDPKFIRFHLDCATFAGIDTFICTWWGQGTNVDYNFRQVLNITNLYHYTQKHTVYFETVQNRYYYNNSLVVQNLYSDMKYLCDTYGNDPAFLRIDSRPVIFIYSTTARPSIQNWTDALALLHTNGYNPFFIVDTHVGNVDSRLVALFDGFHTYNPLGIYHEQPQNALSMFENFVLSSRSNGKLACTTVLAGYNDTQVRHGTPVLQRQNGTQYRDSWNVAIKSKADWVLICTFNEWHEGTEIEPSIENGTYYIDATRANVLLFKS